MICTLLKKSKWKVFDGLDACKKKKKKKGSQDLIILVADKERDRQFGLSVAAARDCVKTMQQFFDHLAQRGVDRRFCVSR